MLSRSELNRLYDLIYQSKDYTSDVDFLLKIQKDFGLNNFAEILEIGCGTGNHTLLLSEKYRDVYAIDIDESMLAAVRQKISANPQIRNIQLFNDQEKSQLSGKNFQIAVSFFNVINYIQTQEVLTAFFSFINSCQARGAIFIFDCYKFENFSEGEKTSNITLQFDDRIITRNTKSNFFYEKQSVIVEEEFLDGEKLLLKNANKYKVWPREKIIESLNNSGFKLIEILNKKTPNQIIFITQKS